jgi:hypothetical protein
MPTAFLTDARHAFVAVFGAFVCTAMLVSASAPAVALIA